MRIINSKNVNIDALSIPFGMIIGPCTVISNTIKVIKDVAKMGFYGLLSLNYRKSAAYTHYQQLQAQKANNDYYKNHGFLHYKNDRRLIDDIVEADEKLSSADRRYIQLEAGKKEFCRHLTYIGIGIIRSIPIVGGLGRWLYTRPLKYTKQTTTLYEGRCNSQGQGVVEARIGEKNVPVSRRLCS